MSGFFVPHDIAGLIKGAASGPLAGLTAAVKDMYDVAGTRTGGGSPDWLAAQAPATKHAAAVQRLLDAGASVIGKTICDELFYSVTGVNSHYGAPPNLRAPGRMPGGSSAGSAAATAAGVCDLALGSDTGGSMRIPASFCGVYGIRTSHGRVDPAGAMAMAPSFDAIGWFAAAPGVFRRAGPVLLDGAAVAGPIRRLLVADDAFAEADAAVNSVVRDALARMQPVLPRSEPVRLAPGGFDAWRETLRVIQAYEVWQTFGRFVEAKKPKLGPGIAERIAASSKITKAEAEAARITHAEIRRHIEALVPPGTVVALPTAPCIAPRLDTAAAELDPFRLRVMRLICTAVLGGLPQVSLPAGTASGCPVGLSFIGWRGGDESLLDLAFNVSRYLGMAGPPA